MQWERVEKMSYRIHVMICAGTGCVAAGSLKIKEKLEEEIAKQNLSSEIGISLTGCKGFCAKGPIVSVLPEGIFYQLLTEEDIPHLITEHFLNGRPVASLMYQPEEKRPDIPLVSEIPFFKYQVLRTLRNKGLIDPENINEYIARDGYLGAAIALLELSPEEIINEVKKSGLRGRGGAGFPTGLKWEFCAKAHSDIKYIICNGDEGDPGAFMDRAILEGDPHSVLEGMIIAAKAIGSHFGYIYCRAEYPLAIKTLNIAIEQAREYGLLGDNILGSGFSFDIEIYQGAGAFVCGEETALMTSIEGKRGMPRPRPPFPAHKGLWGKPSVLNNVETLANIPQIILHGGERYASLGTETSKGTKVFALTGAINNIGLVEVPMGIPLRTIIYEIGGGIANNKKFKAVQIGGPSGGCIPEELLDIPVDYEHITKTGAIMGSGGMVVMDETNCMVSVAKFFLEFTKDESCGKCTPCRCGINMMLKILEAITNGKGQEGDIELLLELSSTIKDTALCGLGKTAPNPVLTTIKYFRDEYEAHIREKKCPSHICRALLTYTIMADVCTGCTLCAKKCPVSCISGEIKHPHKIDQNKCIKCGLCYASCKMKAIAVD